MYIVSIIMPSFNCEDFIAQTIDSVIAQSFPNWELVIVDDFSNDSTYEIAKNYALLDKRIKVHQLKSNTGSPSEPRNYAIKKSVGDFIAFLDSDDLWLPNKLQQQVDFMVKSRCLFSYSAFNLVDHNGDYLQTYVPDLDVVSYKKLLTHNVIGCLTVIIKKDILTSHFLDIGHEDLAFWLSILKKGHTASLCSVRPLASYRIVDQSRSSNKLNAFVSMWHLYRKIENMNYFTSSWNIVRFIVNWYSRRILKT